jgi:hypothetical protein
MAKRNSKDGKGRFIRIPHSVLSHPDYQTLGGNSVKLLNALAYQYNGRNNGNLSAAWGLMRNAGFKSKATITAAIRQLVSHEIIVKTRDGKFQNPNSCCDLYALCWECIDPCEGKNLELKPTRAPYRTFVSTDIKAPRPSSGHISSSKLGRVRSRDERGRYMSDQKLG